MKKWWLILQRRKYEAGLTALVILILGVSAAFLLPPTYRSTATILVNTQEIPQGVADAGYSSYADRRIKLLKREVLSSRHLTQMAVELGLVGQDELEDGKLPLNVLNDLRKRISIDLNKEQVIDSKTRFKVDAVIAFDVSFIDKDPATAKKVTEYITQLFLEQNNKSQPKSAAAAVTLLEKQEKELSKKVKQAEDKLKRFKSKVVYSLPEMKDSNIRALEKINDEISDTRIQLRALQEKRIFLQSELIRLSPTAIAYDSEGGRVLGREDRLKVLRAEYAEKKAKYSANHPDLKRLRREIRSLEGSSSHQASNKGIAADLREAEAKLAVLRQRYSSSHPSVIALKKKIKALKRELKKARSKAMAPARHGEADNPAYISTLSKLKSTELDIRALNETMDNLVAERRRYEERLEKMPLVEREYVQLEREYKQALDEYEAIHEKRFKAQLAGALESKTSSEDLKLLEPADFPEKPFKPNRKLLLAVTGALALWAAIGVALIREHFDDRIWTSEDILAELTDPPLSTVPDFKNNKKKSRKYQDLVLTPQQHS